jgi:hypothetical protein
MSKLATTDEAYAADILRGAREIAIFLFGRTKGVQPAFQRRVYALAADGSIPVFHEGKMLCLRKSIHRAHIAKQEAGE